jgi:lysophospholipase L1-like esterase
MTIKLAVLGDSIAYGQGATDPADTVGARLAAELTAAGTSTELRVFAVPGAQSEALAFQVGRATTWGATLAVIIIGANDLTHFVPPDRAAAQLGAAVRSLRKSGATVVVAPAPDLSAVPWVPLQMRALVSAGSARLREAQTTVARAEGAHIAAISSEVAAAFAADTALFSSDRFHPSSAGYAMIARALAPAVLAAVAA